MDKPYILDETEDFAVVFKPAKIHSTIINEQIKVNDKKLSDNKNDVTLFDWYKSKSEFVFNIMHRLDYETNGLVLFAKNEKSYLFFKEAQENGGFIKEYSAFCVNNNDYCAEGFPPPPMIESFDSPFVIESFFRPFGKGRKLVRPVIEDGKKHKETAKDKGNFYRTEIISKNKNDFTIRIKRGFRHQIRCHLCWIGFPIVNDPLYSCCENEKNISDSVMRLRSHALFFSSPSDGRKLEYRIEPLVSDFKVKF